VRKGEVGGPFSTASSAGEPRRETSRERHQPGHTSRDEKRMRGVNIKGETAEDPGKVKRVPEGSTSSEKKAMKIKISAGVQPGTHEEGNGGVKVSRGFNPMPIPTEKKTVKRNILRTTPA